MNKWLLGKQPDGNWFVFCQEAQVFVAIDIPEKELRTRLRELYFKFLQEIVELEASRTYLRALSRPDMEWEVAAAVSKFGSSGFAEDSEADLSQIVQTYKALPEEEKFDLLQEIRNNE